MSDAMVNFATPLFDGIDEQDLTGMLHCTGYHTAAYKKGQMIHLEQEQIRHIGIVMDGAVDMIMEDIWGNRTLLSRMRSPEMFGETFACSEDNRSMVSFQAAEDSQVVFIPFHKIMHTCTMACQFHHKLVENMVRIIASKNRELLQKIEIMSKKSLREKILAYLSLQAQLQDSRYVQLPLGRVELAQYLCADRSALTRELTNMKAEGLIDFEKNTFKILYTTPLFVACASYRGAFSCYNTEKRRDVYDYGRLPG